MDLCTRFEENGGAKGELDESLSVDTVTQSEDTIQLGGVSKLSSIFKQDVKLDPQPSNFCSNFSSLRDIWEPSNIKPARKQTLIQRKIILSSTGFSLVRSSPNKRKGGSGDNSSAGKRNRPGG